MGTLSDHPVKEVQTMISKIILPIAGTLLCYLLLQVFQVIYRNLTWPLRHVVGPKNASLIFGNFKDMADDPHLTTKWRSEFGANFVFSGLFSISELHTSDLKAINHIVARPEIYQKPPSLLNYTELLIGKGVLTVELDEHKRHRRALNPAFGVAQIRAVTEIFVEKAVQLREIWARQAEQQNGAASVDVLAWLRRMTLDVIGQAGFNYQFDALEVKGKSTELNEAFTKLFHSPQTNSYDLFRVSQAIMPVLSLLPGPGRNLGRAARNQMYTIGKQIVSKSKADVKAAEGEKSLSGKRDLLSVLLKANLSTTIPETQRLNDTEVVSEIPAFFFAGHETTSSATAWALYALSVNTVAQTKLREELLTMSTDNPTMDELHSLPYLEHVVRETMRLHAPVVATQRMAMKDDVLPLSKPYIDREGRAHDSLPPERWENIPASVSNIPGVWANLLTFFAGPHNCIGFRFSLVEMKALLFTLIRAFEFEQAVPKGGIGPFTAGLIQSPTVLGKGKGSGLPLIVKPHNMKL
ncbi:hypothetical protein MVEN_00861700 [Mycena venus]|uniref:Cytochrome P450 n=1 Tax=Mycena venus TaxID=2733690 RepID=A0A8H7D3Z8_9AGAR|nr:hypothetical protein MVEN_00861700 [Mycena venus]